MFRTIAGELVGDLILEEIGRRPVSFLLLSSIVAAVSVRTAGSRLGDQAAPASGMLQEEHAFSSDKIKALGS